MAYKVKFKEGAANYFTGRADGEPANEPANEPTPMAYANAATTAANALGDLFGGNNRRRAGLRINSVFFTMESIMLTAILVVLVVIACKK